MEESKSNITYLMHPDLFLHLSSVRGFNTMNGENYQAHILMVFNERLSSEEKNIIMSMQTPQDALGALEKMGIYYTHDMEQ